MKTCPNCKQQNKEENSFCEYCGSSLNSGLILEVQEPKKKRTVLIAVLCLALVVTSCGIGWWLYSNRIEKNYEQSLEIARRYLEVQNYEKAEACYLDAIHIKPKREEPYVELAELYVETDQPEKLEDLQQMAEENLDEAGKDIVDEIADGNIQSKPDGSSTPSNALSDKEISDAFGGLTKNELELAVAGFQTVFQHQTLDALNIAKNILMYGNDLSVIQSNKENHYDLDKINKILKPFGYNLDSKDSSVSAFIDKDGFHLDGIEQYSDINTTIESIHDTASGYEIIFNYEYEPNGASWNRENRGSLQFEKSADGILNWVQPEYNAVIPTTYFDGGPGKRDESGISLSDYQNPLYPEFSDTTLDFAGLQGIAGILRYLSGIEPEIPAFESKLTYEENGSGLKIATTSSMAEYLNAELSGTAYENYGYKGYSINPLDSADSAVARNDFLVQLRMRLAANMPVLILLDYNHFRPAVAGDSWFVLTGYSLDDEGNIEWVSGVDANRRPFTDGWGVTHVLEAVDAYGSWNYVA